MPEPTPLKLALAETLDRRGVDPAAATTALPELDDDPYMRQEVLRQAGEYADKHIPARYADAVADAPVVIDWLRLVLDRAVSESVMNAQCSVRTGPSLLILGPTGVGKTHQAYGAIRLLSQSGVRCAWKAIAAADLYAKLRPRHGVDSESEFRALADSPLLLVDDLGAAKTSEWVEEVNYRLVNWRYERVLPTLFTSNVRPKELAGGLGERVASRLIEMTERVVLEGVDRRRVQVP